MAGLHQITTYFSHLFHVRRFVISAAKLNGHATWNFLSWNSKMVRTRVQADTHELLDQRDACRAVNEFTADPKQYECP